MDAKTSAARWAMAGVAVGLLLGAAAAGAVPNHLYEGELGHATAGRPECEVSQDLLKTARKCMVSSTKYCSLLF